MNARAYCMLLVVMLLLPFCESCNKDAQTTAQIIVANTISYGERVYEQQLVECGDALTCPKAEATRKGLDELYVVRKFLQQPLETECDVLQASLTTAEPYLIHADEDTLLWFYLLKTVVDVHCTTEPNEVLMKMKRPQISY